MHKTQSIILVAAAALTAAGCSSIGEQIKTSGAMGSEDTSYISTAYELAQLDKQAGILVQSKAQDPRVIDASHQLVAQAQALTPELSDALKSQGIMPPQKLSAKVSAELDKLRGLDGPAFDQAYVADEIELHQQAVKVFQKENADTKNTAMRTQVEAELPAVQTDLAKLQSIINPSS